MNWRSPWARLGLVAVVGIGAAAGWASFQEYERSARIKREIEVLRQEAERVAQENETLAEKIEYFASPDFKEREAKEKLGLRRQEEKVVAFQGQPTLGGMEPLSPPSESRPLDWSEPNYMKWWQRFFSREPLR